jgi:hypothetical protein
MRTALLAIGTGADAGRTWLVAVGGREELADRRRRLWQRYVTTTPAGRRTPAIDRLVLVPAAHPATVRAERSDALAALAGTRADKAAPVPASA